MGLNIEKAIADALKTQLQSETYISTNSIPVIIAGDNSINQQYPVIAISWGSAIRIEPNYNKYETPITIICATYCDDDKNQSVLNSLYQAVMGVLSSLTAATISCDGIISSNQSSELEINENEQMRAIGLLVYKSG